MWKSYLDEIREEVRLGSGVFGEDDDLRGLLEECFHEGDALNGIVYWKGCPTPFYGEGEEDWKNVSKATRRDILSADAASSRPNCFQGINCCSGDSRDTLDC
jgi:hypothetical protein